MLRSRFLVPAIALLAMLAAAIPALAQEDADAPPPSHSAELRLWQSVSEPLNLWLSASPDGESGWVTRSLNVAMREGGGWRVAERTVDALDGELDVRVWQHPGDLREIWVSARPAGGSWEEYGTVRVELDSRSRSGRYRYGDASVALEWPDDEPPLPGEDADALCIPDDMGTDSVRTRVWRSVATPHRYWISAQADDDARWITRSVSLAATGEDGWRAGGRTVDAGDADFELRLWDGGRDGLYLSARVTGTTWHEYGARPIDLNRTSASGAYTYANRTVRLTLPEAEPPDPGEAARDWDCAETGAGPGGGAGESLTLTANAGPDQHVPSGAVTLDGSGSTAPAGSTISYEWAQTSGANVTLSGADTASASFTLPSGASTGDTFTFTLTVSDGEGGSDEDSVTVTVNTPPSVDIAISISVTSQGAGAVSAQGNTPTVDCTAASVECARRGMTVNLTAMVTDPGDTFTYSWAKTGGTYTGAISITDSNKASASFVMPKSARHGQTVIITLTVTDSYGATGTATVTITATNRVPYADAGDDQTASVGDTVTLDGSGSADPDGDTITYSWAKTGGTYDGAVTLSDATAESPTFEVDAALAGLTAEFTLTVNDGHGGTDTDSVTVTVNQQQGGGGAPPGGGGPPVTSPGSQQNAAPVADAGANVTVAPGAIVKLDGGGSTDPDGNNTISTYEWEKTGGSYDGTTTSFTIADGKVSSVTMPTDATEDETLVITLTVTDDGSKTSTDTVTITVAKSALTLDAGADASVQRGATHNLTGATYTDPDNDATYKWTSSIGSVTNSTSRTGASFTVPIQGTRHNDKIVLTLTVTDEGKTYTDTLTITALNSAPTNVSATATNTDVNRGSDARLSGSADDSNNGDPLTYSWEHTAGTYCTDYTSTSDCKLDDLSGAGPSFTMPTDADVDETITFTLTVTDGAGDTGTDTVTITAKNAPPTAEAGNAQTVNQGATVNLSGSGSDDDGTISKTTGYSWAKTGGTYTGTVTLSSPNAQDKSKARFTAPNLTGLTSTVQSKTIILTLTVTDANSATATDTVTITVQNAAPTVSISGTPTKVTTGNSYTLTATATDPDGNAPTPTWSVSGDTPLPTVTNGVVTIATGAAVDDSYTVTASVTDADNATATDSVTLTVTDLNRAPSTPTVSAANSNTSKGTTINQGDTVNLTASSTDPDTSANGDTVSYSWAKTGGTHTGAVTITNATSASASFTAPDLTGLTSSSQSKTLIFTVTASDGKGGSATNTVTVTVTNAKPTVSVTVPANVTAGNSVSPTATVNDPDGDNDDITYSWSSTGLTITNANTASPSIAIPWKTNSLLTPIGTQYTAYVTVTDEDNGSSSEQSFKLTVNNRKPNAVASGTKNGNAGDLITLLGSSSTDPDEDNQGGFNPFTCSWAHTGGTYDGTRSHTTTTPITISNNSTICGPATYTVPGDATSGETIIATLTVTDRKGGTDTATWTLNDPNPPSTPVTPTLPSNQAPTANAGPDQNFKMVSATDSTKNVATVDASKSSDPENGALTYSWRARGSYAQYVGLPADNVNPSKSSVRFIWPSQAPIGGKIEIAVTVCDPKNACHTDSAILTRKNAPPVPNSGADESYSQKRGTPYVANRNGSATDVEGHTPLTFWWAQPTKPNSTEYMGTYGKDIALTNENSFGIVSGASVQATMPQCTGANGIRHGETIVLRLSARDSYTSDPQIGTHDVTFTANFLKRTDSSTNAAPTLGEATVRLTLTGGSSAITLDARTLVSDDATSDANMWYKWELLSTAGFTMTVNPDPTNGAAVTFGVGTAGVGTEEDGLKLTVVDEDCMATERLYDIGVTSN